MIKITKISLNEYKVASFHGKPIIVPYNCRYIAIDENGKIYGYTKKPILGICWNWFAPEFSQYFNLGTCEFDGDWEQSLVEV